MTNISGDIIILLNTTQYHCPVLISLVPKLKMILLLIAMDINYYSYRTNVNVLPFLATLKILVPTLVVSLSVLFPFLSIPKSLFKVARSCFTD